MDQTRSSANDASLLAAMQIIDEIDQHGSTLKNLFLDNCKVRTTICGAGTIVWWGEGRTIVRWGPLPPPPPPPVGGKRKPNAPRLRIRCPPRKLIRWYPHVFRFSSAVSTRLGRRNSRRWSAKLEEYGNNSKL